MAMGIIIGNNVTKRRDTDIFIDAGRDRTKSKSVRTVDNDYYTNTH